MGKPKSSLVSSLIAVGGMPRLLLLSAVSNAVVPNPREVKVWFFLGSQAASSSAKFPLVLLEWFILFVLPLAFPNMDHSAGWLNEEIESDFAAVASVAGGFVCPLGTSGSSFVASFGKA